VGDQRQHWRVVADYVDEEARPVYLPVEDPTSDYYGGHRPGNNLFGDSIVCVDLKTGQRKCGTSADRTIRSGTTTCRRR
jgi:glucose dehydrogenase